MNINTAKEFVENIEREMVANNEYRGDNTKIVYSILDGLQIMSHRNKWDLFITHIKEKIDEYTKLADEYRLDGKIELADQCSKSINDLYDIRNIFYEIVKPTSWGDSEY